MFLEIKCYRIVKSHFIFSILSFLICFQILTLQDVFSTTDKSFESTNASSFTSNFKKKFINISDGETNSTVNQTANKDKQKIKIVTAGDFGCRPVAQNNIKQIELQNPDIFLALGDLSYKPTMDCWYDMTKNLDSKTKIAIGNHEDDEEEMKGGSEELKYSLLEHYNLPNSFYSFDYGNVHFLVLDTELEFSFNVFKQEEEDQEKYGNNKYKESNMPDEKYYDTTLEDLLAKHNIKGEIPPFHLLDEKVVVENMSRNTEQNKFVLNDLKKASNDPSTNWIVVMFHKPMYSSLSSQMQEYIMREKYQPIFDKYGVDLVLQGHNHIYDRTLPIKFNPSNISKPVVDESNDTNQFFNPEGTIFSVIGLGGRSSNIILNQPEYVMKQHNGFGFLSIEIDENRLDAKYYDIGYKCKEDELKESDLKEGDFTIFDMSSCYKDNNTNSLEIIDHYIISKIS
ncbi:MAG: metallophosphoesterase [Nitrososphaeraceae archaeon]